MSAPFLTVVVPAYRCAATLERCLAALRASTLPPAEWELVVADDGSDDDTGAVARRHADRVVRVADGPRGPARARNDGAATAAGEVLVFVDADVCVAAPALAQFAALFRERPGLAAAFGAYDQEPEAPGLVSQYRNLTHHRVHACAAGPAVTFWAGCGAVRRDVFQAAGGFDAERYPRPQIEDVELGYRLSARGHRILLAPAIQGRHLKRWTFAGGVVTDFRDRAVPWMRLLVERGEVAAAGPLNLQAREKAYTALASSGSVALVVAAMLRSPVLAAAAGAALLVALAGSLPLLRWLASVRGWRFAAACVPLRLAYYLLNACAAAWVMLGPAPRALPARRAAALAPSREPL